MAMTEDMARKMVGIPLSPAVLEEIQALNEFPRVLPDFDPVGSWTQVYRIWLNHGYYGLLNLNAGFLRIERRKGVSDNRFTLAVEQHAIHWEGIANSIQAEIACAADPVATPLSWSYTSRFTDTKGADVPELTVTHAAQNDGGTVTYTINDKRSIVRADASVTADWCLFEAVQRLPFGEGVIGEFDVLDGLTALKKSHRLSYRVNAADTFKNLAIPLHSYYQIGAGVLPYEYWLDNNHRLLMAISGDRLYILDDSAEKTFAEEVAAHRGGKYSWQNRL